MAKATTVNVIGWTFNNITNGHFNIGSEHEHYKKCGEGEAWFGYGYSTRDLVGSISTKLFGCGRGVLDFGNCNTEGVVRVYLNGQRIGVAFPNTPSKLIEFDFYDGSLLELREFKSMIQFNNFHILDCGVSCKKK